MRLQALIAGTLLAAAVVLLAAGFWVVGGLFGLLAILPLAAFLDSVVIWMTTRNPRHWPEPPPIRPSDPKTNLAGAHSPIRAPRPQTIVRARRSFQWSWFVPGFMIGWSTWFRARWGELRDIVS